MSNESQAMKYGREIVEKHPNLRSEVEDLMQLAYDEIEEGGSPTHEWELCLGSMKELLNENS